MREQLASELVFLLTLGVVGCALGLTDATRDICALVLLTLCLGEAVRLAVTYFTNHGFWAQVARVADPEPHEDPMRTAADLPEPACGRAALAADALDAVRCEGLRRIGAERRDAREYRDFIELWGHEVKTPLAAASLIAANHPGPCADAMAPELQRIEASVEQALFVARSYTVNRDYLVRSASLDDLTAQAVRSRMSLLMAANAQVRCEGLGQTVPCDPKWAVFILGQLLDNAVKYACPDRPLTVEVTARRLDQGGANERVELTVADNGSGICAADLPRVWDKGFTGANGRATAGGTSTGMGLYLVRTLCDKTALGCSIASDGVSGTQVRLVFPALAVGGGG